MDAVTLLNDKVDMEILLKYYDFDKVRREGSIIRACCKIHGGDNPTSFVVNEENKLFYCHTSCGGGDAFTLVQRIEKIDFPQAVRKLAELFNVDITHLHIMERKIEYMEEIKKWLKTMRSKTKKKDIQAFVIPEPIREVTKYRMFREDTLKHFGLGFVDSVTLDKRDTGTYTLHNRLVFPIRFNDIQVGISFRKTKAQDFPKWSHQPARLHVNEILYNYDHVKNERKIVIVEGITDTWAYYEIGIPAVCTFGAHLTDEQYKLLFRTGADLVFSYDGDDAGRLATERAIKLFKHKCNLERVAFAEGEDPESISREELQKRYEQRVRC